MIGFKMAQISEGTTDSDISESTHSLAELSSPEFLSRQCSEIDAMAAKVVFENEVKDAFQNAIADCQFCVTVADPRDPDFALIAVSDQFEAITGYSKAEILGRNCRLLRLGCHPAPYEHLCLRTACRTGAGFTAVLTNRRKSGETFLHLIDLRGLTVAKNPSTGEELWFLVGIQTDVTHMADDVEKDAIPQLQEIAGRIRAKLVDELKAFVVAGALMTNFEGHEKLNECQDAWCVLPEPLWNDRLLGAAPSNSPEKPMELKVSGDGLVELSENSHSAQGPKSTPPKQKNNNTLLSELVLAAGATFGGALLLHFLGKTMLSRR